ncbi:MAG: isoleucine--tRNA ligase [Bacteroidetes bacterium]|jgi:isoleucyl-tRNA synthetase|nr:isoleucine--tRNA ligase [Bacteroidota bacterium]
MFTPLSDRLKYAELESAVRRFWEQESVFPRSIAQRAGRPVFSFYEGPPTANGRPGIHHVMSRTLKDLVCRYKTMKGFQVHRKAGWDTHGLPVEIEVEKSLGFKHKDEIVRYGVAKFNDECRRSVWKYKAEWEEMTRTMGYWVDLDAPYVTFENSYIESVWWALRQYFDRGMIYKGYKIQPYCPRCETPLSSHEVSLGYKDVKDPSVYVRMKVKGVANTSFLVWTTTPWTLISNVAIAVHPDVDYVKAEHQGETFILAEARLSVLGDGTTVVGRMKGRELVGMEYERLYAFHDVKERGWYVIDADFVTTEDGSGIVHMAPAYGEDDYQAGRKHGLPTIHPVTASGEFSSEVTPFANKFVKDADPEIIADLKARGLLFKKEQYLHSYPHCWRCSSPLLYYARDSWYIRTTSYAQRMIELNNRVNWFPPEVGAGRFGNWLEENKDWALSRDRFWGTPLPIWVCETCGTKKCVGSIEELKQGQHVPDPLDLHKPHVDDVTFTCSCGGTQRRTPELIDVWFDSGSMPFAQWHYPFENKERFESTYPGDFISEGIDQTRGWFYTLHSIGTFLFDKPAFRNVLVNELILDKSGLKMSKSKGNTVEPFGLMQTYGADATRWYLVSNSPVWRPTLFDAEGIAEVQRKYFSTLVNTYSFFALYANVDGFDPSSGPVPHDERPEIDRWILSELHTLIREVNGALDVYDATRATRLLTDYTVDRLSNWYVRRNRRRFWKSEPGADKTSAYQTLHECLVTVTKLMAPIAPFLSDELFRRLRPGAASDASVHLTDFPVENGSLIDTALEEKMERAMTIVSLVRSMREKTKLKVRQPLARILIPVLSERVRNEVQQMSDLILDEINVKAIEFITDDTAIVRRKAKPDFRALGAKHGKAVQGVAAAIRELTSSQLRDLEVNGSLAIAANGTTVEIARTDVEIQHEEIKGWLVASDGPMTVALDTTITEELAREGLAREFVNRVQNLRKDSGFQVTDRIRIRVATSDRLRAALEAMDTYIRQETLASELLFIDGTSASMQRLDVNGEAADVAVEKI